MLASLLPDPSASGAPWGAPSPRMSERPASPHESSTPVPAPPLPMPPSRLGSTGSSRGSAAHTKLSARIAGLETELVQLLETHVSPKNIAALRALLAGQARIEQELAKQRQDMSALLRLRA